MLRKEVSKYSTEMTEVSFQKTADYFIAIPEIFMILPRSPGTQNEYYFFQGENPGISWVEWYARVEN